MITLSNANTESQDDGEHTCMCKEDKMICSNEGKTYPTICSLNEEAIERGEPDTYIPKLFMEYWGPCKEGKIFSVGTRENI